MLTRGNLFIQAEQTKERAANLQLLEVLKQERAMLVTHGQQMNSTLDFILHKSRFLVDKYCQSTGNGTLFYLIWSLQCNVFLFCFIHLIWAILRRRGSVYSLPSKLDSKWLQLLLFPYRKPLEKVERESRILQGIWSSSGHNRQRGWTGI